MDSVMKGLTGGINDGAMPPPQNFWARTAPDDCIVLATHKTQPICQVCSLAIVLYYKKRRITTEANNFNNYRQFIYCQIS